MSTYAEIKEQTLILLGDSYAGSSTFEDSQILDAINFAQEQMAQLLGLTYTESINYILNNIGGGEEAVTGGTYIIGISSDIIGIPSKEDIIKMVSVSLVDISEDDPQLFAYRPPLQKKFTCEPASIETDLFLTGDPDYIHEFTVDFTIEIDASVDDSHRYALPIGVANSKLTGVRYSGDSSFGVVVNGAKCKFTSTGAYSESFDYIPSYDQINVNISVWGFQTVTMWFSIKESDIVGSSIETYPGLKNGFDAYGVPDFDTTYLSEGGNLYTSIIINVI